VQIQENGGESLILRDYPSRLFAGCARRSRRRFGGPFNRSNGVGNGLADLGQFRRKSHPSSGNRRWRQCTCILVICV